MKIILRVGGPRAAVELAEANQIVERFQSESEGNTVVGVDLSCRQWKQESLDQVETFLAGVAGDVRYLKIDDIIAGLNTDEGLSVTEKLANVFDKADLLEINLNDNAMGPRGLGRVGSLFANSNLQRLYLSNCGLSHHSMIQLHDYIMADNGRVAKSLRELVLDKNMIGAEGAEQVAKFLPHCKNLETFSYRGCRPIKAGTKHIAEGLLALSESTEEPAISHLDLEDCTFGSGDDEDEDAIAPFAKALGKFKHLRFLNMKDGDIGCGGLSLLLDALKTSNARLTDFLLDANGEIGSEGAEMLGEWLISQVTLLRRLHLSLNELGDDGVAAILVPFAASRNELVDLALEQNEIENEGVQALLKARLPALRELNLSDNDEIDEDKREQLKTKFGRECRVRFDEDDAVDDLAARMGAARIG
mmetsp:Transcript_22802/g.42384  ORF Transcript_22802/g.42384 Transcript_22802/m.42384 type:complete len:418 (+) Transcript_22802:41-1294(+)